MTVQASPSFLTMLSITVLLLVSDNTTSAHADDNSVPVHGQGSSHNPIVYHPVHGQGSTHDPIVHRTKPRITPRGWASHMQASPSAVPSWRHSDCQRPMFAVTAAFHRESLPSRGTDTIRDLGLTLDAREFTAHGRELGLGERNSGSAPLTRNLDEGRLQAHFASRFRLDLDEAGFGASGNLAGKLYSVTHANHP